MRLMGNVVIMRILIAGATGLIGIRLVPLLVAAGHDVAGITRTQAKAQSLRDLGSSPIVCDVYDAAALAAATSAFAPDVVLNELTDLPDSLADLAASRDNNNRMRTEGTANLIAAAAGTKMIAQSISWEPGPAAHERAVLESGGVIIRYGQLYGPGTYYPDTPPDRPRIHIDDAARLTIPVLEAPAGLTVVIDDRAL
jgi:NAD(P)-dependent dehydrogenase (short-subunit alcohol dehydrogenase family)